MDGSVDSSSPTREGHLPAAVAAALPPLLTPRTRKRAAVEHFEKVYDYISTDTISSPPQAALRYIGEQMQQATRLARERTGTPAYFGAALEHGNSQAFAMEVEEWPSSAGEMGSPFLPLEPLPTLPASTEASQNGSQISLPSSPLLQHPADLPSSSLSSSLFTSSPVLPRSMLQPHPPNQTPHTASAATTSSTATPPTSVSGSSSGSSSGEDEDDEFDPTKSSSSEDEESEGEATEGSDAEGADEGEENCSEGSKRGTKRARGQDPNEGGRKGKRGQAGKPKANPRRVFHFDKKFLGAARFGAGGILASLSHALLRPDTQRRLAQLLLDIKNTPALPTPPSPCAPRSSSRLSRTAHSGSESSALVDRLAVWVKRVGVHERTAALTWFYRAVDVINLGCAVAELQDELHARGQKYSLRNHVYPSLPEAVKASMTCNALEERYIEARVMSALVRHCGVHLLVVLAALHQEARALTQNVKGAREIMGVLESPKDARFKWVIPGLVQSLGATLVVLRARGGVIPLHLNHGLVQLGADPVDDQRHFPLPNSAKSSKQADLLEFDSSKILRTLGLHSSDERHVKVADGFLAWSSAEVFGSRLSELSMVLQNARRSAEPGVASSSLSSSSLLTAMADNFLEKITRINQVELKIADKIHLDRGNAHPKFKFPSSFSLGTARRKARLLQHWQGRPPNSRKRGSAAKVEKVPEDGFDRLYDALTLASSNARRIDSAEDLGEGFEAGSEWILVGSGFTKKNHLLVKHPTDASKSILHVVARPAESTKLARDALRAFHGLFPAELVDFVREEGDDLHALAFHFACWNRYGRLSTNAAGRVVGTGNGGGFPHISEDTHAMGDVGGGFLARMAGVLKVREQVLAHYHPEALEELSRLIDSLQGVIPSLTAPYSSCAANYDVATGFHIDPQDLEGSFCAVFVCGRFKGGDLIIPELKLRLELPPGSLVFFHSAHLVHGNSPVEREEGGEEEVEVEDVAMEVEGQRGEFGGEWRGRPAVNGERLSFVSFTDGSLVRWADEANGATESSEDLEAKRVKRNDARRGRCS